MFSQKNKQGWRNPWVIGLIMIVLSGVLINARMVWNVEHHPTRLLDEHYTVRAHNKYGAKWVEEQAERSTLGWQAVLSSPQQLPNDAMAEPRTRRFVLLGSPALLKFSLQDQEGSAVEDSKVEIDAQWPGDPKLDFKSVLSEKAKGVYEGNVKFPRSGNWDLIIKVEQQGRQFDVEQKVFVEIAKQP